MVSLNPKKLHNLPELFEGNKLEWKRKILVFSFFFVLSFIIWFLNALSKNYTTDIKYPIKYTNFPQNKVLVSKLPDHLGLKINAHGYALLRYKILNRPVPIYFRVGSFAMNRFSNDSSKLYLLTRYAREQVARQLPSELQLVDISPDSLIFQFANQVEKLVPVKPVLDYQVAKEFTIIGTIRLDPDSVLVSGPDLYMDTLQDIPTESRSLGLLQKSYSGQLELKRYKDFTYHAEKVKCDIELEKLTEIQLQVPIQVSGLPDSIRMQTFPQTVRVSGSVGLSNYDRVVPESFWAEVNYQEVKEKKQRLQVKLVKYPGYLKNVDIYPKSVEYLLSVR